VLITWIIRIKTLPQLAPTLLAILAASLSPVEACTAFQLKSKDGAEIYARSMEFGAEDITSNAKPLAAESSTNPGRPVEITKLPSRRGLPALTAKAHED